MYYIVYYYMEKSPNVNGINLHKYKNSIISMIYTTKHDM